ncbi:hypothetical protein D5R81_20120 [Parashewanella spongiae]|uniref:Uncharacterized protein n=1 Tax=Parashewanella spongiae TaxID=342950 RepID=A0A3A6T1H2_9GAMM|nr:hypothetical protein D5R81_20120 [Parashewanella spongiae]
MALSKICCFSQPTRKSPEKTELTAQQCLHGFEMSVNHKNGLSNFFDLQEIGHGFYAFVSTQADQKTNWLILCTFQFLLLNNY